ncbi:hypothetical protein [Pelagibius sp. Alg239-R121]|uniref:hypothetical protein n=1 Tax=Pelagibius sp. Alg239-R121 TaxID=2993448 RepID=UPI0024A77434|nr:hypothetical protein [Pelagibius sp. Alg239-R121]
MNVDFDTPQRMTVVVEKNKSDTWSLASYLITADGQRRRNALGIFESYSDATHALQQHWQHTSI